MTPASAPDIVVRAGPARLLLFAVFALALANALAYTLEFTNPVAMADAWYFLDVFISKDVEGGLAWTDYFAKRAASDHSQPLHKLILALNTRWFDLDFMFEAVLGVIGIALCAAMLLRLAWRERDRAARIDAGEVALLCLVPLLLFSLNSTEIYIWSLVTLFFLMFPFVLQMFASGWPRAERRGRWILAFATFAAMIALDGAGLLAAVALLVALALEGWRGANWREACLRGAIVIGVVLLYRVAYAVLIPASVADGSSLGANVTALLSSVDEAWRWAIYPAAGSLIHVDHLDAWFGNGATLATIVLGSLVLVLHLFFWRSVLRMPAGSRTSFVALCLMLFVYALVAGIVIGRVPDYGASYLWQHRYVAFYQLANVALVLQWIAARASSDAAAGNRLWVNTALPLLACVVVLSLQVSLSVRAWEFGKHFRYSAAGMASTIQCLSEHPQLANPVCEPNHVVCGWPPDLRNRLVGVLRAHRLNVFSPAFQRRHQMPSAAPDIERCVPRG